MYGFEIKHSRSTFKEFSMVLQSMIEKYKTKIYTAMRSFPRTWNNDPIVIYPWYYVLTIQSSPYYLPEIIATRGLRKMETDVVLKE